MSDRDTSSIYIPPYRDLRHAPDANKNSDNWKLLLLCSVAVGLILIIVFGVNYV